MRKMFALVSNKSSNKREESTFLINNAGLLIYGEVEEISLEEARLQFDTNFCGAVQMIKECLPLMRQQGGGHIVNISSLAALLGIPFWSYYTASKAAVEAFSTSLRYECRPWKIMVSLIEAGRYRYWFHR